MKKVVALLLVLGLSVVANAALVTDISVNGEEWDGVADVSPSDEIVINWRADEPVNGGFSNAIIAVTNTELVSFAVKNFLIQNMTAAQVENDVVVSGGASWFGFPGGDVAELIIHVPDVPASTNIIIDMTQGTFAGFSIPSVEGPDDDGPYVVMHVVPEPLTLSLLGLGGLVLRRRR